MGNLQSMDGPEYPMQLVEDREELIGMVIKADNGNDNTALGKFPHFQLDISNAISHIISLESLHTHPQRTHQHQHESLATLRSFLANADAFDGRQATEALSSLLLVDPLQIFYHVRPLVVDLVARCLMRLAAHPSKALALQIFAALARLLPHCAHLSAYVMCGGTVVVVVVVVDGGLIFLDMPPTLQSNSVTTFPMQVLT